MVQMCSITNTAHPCDLVMCVHGTPHADTWMFTCLNVYMFTCLNVYLFKCLQVTPASKSALPALVRVGRSFPPPHSSLGVLDLSQAKKKTCYATSPF